MRLRGHQTGLHYGEKMPLTPRAQKHFTPSAGDNVQTIVHSAGHFYDANVTYVPTLVDPIDHEPGTLLLAHYPFPWLNGYRYWHGPAGHGKRVKIPLSRRHWSYDRWGERGLNLQRANGERTLHYDAALDKSVRVGACPIPETKSRAFATSDRPWQLLKRDHERHDVPLWPKTLVTMWGFKAKVVRAAKNSVPLAAIYGKGLKGRARRLARTRVLESGWKDGTRVYATW